jgi:uncharacterized protein (DUF433 family)
VADDIRFTRPLYTVAQAARYVGMPPSTLTAWAKGYTKHFPDRPPVVQGPVITAIPPGSPGGPTVPFIGLVEATVVQAFRRTGLPLQRVRKALQVLADQGELEHALASKRLYTDGAEVLYEYANEAGDQMLRLLTVVSSGQRVFHEVIVDYLSRISFDDAWATGLVLPVTGPELLRVDPVVASGDPIFLHGGAPLSAVVSRHKAGESTRSIAADYEVPASDIEEALRAVVPQAA